MVVITLTDCPPRLRGDLTKWMLEINTGVYVGNFSARVRDGLWKRVRENIKNGRAVMIYSTHGEQRFGFEVHNSRWVPEDFDGVKLIRHMSMEKHEDNDEKDSDLSHHQVVSSKAATMRMAALKKRGSFKLSSVKQYVVLDLETTGLDILTDHIIEIGAIKVEEGRVIDDFNCLIVHEGSLPKETTEITGITDEMLCSSGKRLVDVLPELHEFLGDNIIVCHNSTFEQMFLKRAFCKADLPEPENSFLDTLELARKKIRNVKDYKLITLANYLGIEHTVMHRALPDCRITFELFEKLKEF